MAPRRPHDPIEPMTLGNMRANGVRSCSSRAGAATTGQCWGPTAGRMIPVPTRPAHGVHAVRDHRCGRAAELEGAPAREPDRRAMAVLSQPAGTLLDHFVGGGQQRFRDGEAERLGGLEVHDHLKFGRLDDRQVGGFLTLEDAAGIDAHLPS
jgi:hypothetical protein